MYREIRPVVLRQYPALLRAAFWLSLTLLPVLAIAAFARARYDIPWEHLLGDPSSALGGPFYIGFVSSVGIVLWAAAATVFLFGHHLLARRAGDAESRRFLLASGVFVGWLGLDDLFLLHDEVFPDVLGISQAVVVTAYAAAALLYLGRFAAIILRTDFLLLLGAFVLFAVSLALDQFHGLRQLFRFAVFWEDAAKLLGIGAWLCYALRATLAAVEREAR